MVMKDVWSNGDVGEKPNQQRHRHTTTKHLSIQKSARDKKLTFKFEVKNWDMEWERDYEVGFHPSYGNADWVDWKQNGQRQ